ncbi:MAG: MotA/TolQ/ExbB proton channel family protein [Bacteroidota bacterium]|jgi:biopolymer transport protein ExbB|uniref:MotA/TolQ/ExbB proton channel family protein n=1 Tax=Pedobacter cryotolerans TaxID=2571270 RepID=A0A4U1C768_9SPHI|nr:MotA/TolQ/ExbB proton channel family protein [Pedobacter cryotolerans]TKC01956.1 MotA/TolQ/ExbB proton channel family protein [Pedobacter cryotolerans]
MANAPKPTTVKKESSSSSASNLFATLVIPICIAIGVCIFIFLLGDASNFIDNNKENLPKQGNYAGMAYKGGPIVAILIGLLLMVIVFSVERLIVIGKATGKGGLDTFIKKIQGFLNTNNIEAATAECDKQEGSVANVIKSGLKKYREMEVETNMDTDQKCLAIQKDIEEATTLEMPMLEQNLTVIATLVSIGTLTGLLGTVTGMIKAFAGLANSGAPDQAALAVGISEALMCTATGIGTSTLAIIMYNVLTSKIDKLTYAIDEAGFSIIQTYASTHK